MPYCCQPLQFAFSFMQTDFQCCVVPSGCIFALLYKLTDAKLAKQQRQVVLGDKPYIILTLFSRSRLGVHCIPSGCSHDASAPTVVHLFLCHAHSSGSGHTSKMYMISFWKNIFTFGNVFILSRPSSVQFVAMEVVMTSITDMFPMKIRRAGRRERLLLLFCLICFFSQLVMITEVILTFF